MFQRVVLGNPLLEFCKGFLVLVLVSCLCSRLAQFNVVADFSHCSSVALQFLQLPLTWQMSDVAQDHWRIGLPSTGDSVACYAECIIVVEVVACHAECSLLKSVVVCSLLGLLSQLIVIADWSCVFAHSWNFVMVLFQTIVGVVELGMELFDRIVVSICNWYFKRLQASLTIDVILQL